MKYTGRLTCHAALKSLLIGLLTLTPLLTPGRAEAGGYPPTTGVQYSGTVKPVRNLAQYDGTVTGPYTTVYRGDYNSGSEVSGRHPGVDIAQPRNTPVRAIAEGIIIYAGDPGGRGGLRVIVEHWDVPQLGGHGGGMVYSYYAHLDHLDANISANRRVLRGSVIGFVGDSGGGTGVHLHFQLQNYLTSPHLYAPSITQAMRAAGQLTLAEVGNDIHDARYYYNHSTPADDVTTRTYNAMRLVQAHEVKTQFVSNTGTYYNGINFNTRLEGRNDPEIDFEWFNGSPIPRVVPVNYFSVRWQGTIHLDETSWYTFYTTSDDGIRLWVDGRVIIDKWQPQSPHTYAAIRWLEAGDHNIRVDYFENTGGAVAQLAWQKMPSFTGYYWSNSETFNNWTYADPTLIRQDPSPFDFAWGTDSPAPGTVSPDYFSVRWLGKIDVPSGQWHKLYVRADDGIQVRVDGRIVTHRWLVQGPTTYGAETWLSGGSHSLEVRYYEHTGGATAKLWWAHSAGVIPGSRTGGSGTPRYGGGWQTDAIYDVGSWRPSEFYWGVEHIDIIRSTWDDCYTLHTCAEGWHGGDEAEYLMMLGRGYYTVLQVWAKDDHPPPTYLRIWIDGVDKGLVSFNYGHNCNCLQSILLDDPNVRLADDISYGPHAISIEFTNDYYQPPNDRNLYLDGLQVNHW